MGRVAKFKAKSLVSANFRLPEQLGTGELTRPRRMLKEVFCFQNPSPDK